MADDIPTQMSQWEPMDDSNTAFSREGDGVLEFVYRNESGLYWNATRYNYNISDRRETSKLFHTPQEAFSEFGSELPPSIEPESPWKRRASPSGDDYWERVGLESGEPRRVVYQEYGGGWTASEPGGFSDTIIGHSPDAAGAFRLFGDDPPPGIPEPPPRSVSEVTITSNGKGTDDCPGVSVEGELFHGTSRDMDVLQNIPRKYADPYWIQYGGDAPAIYLTEDYPTAVLYAQQAKYSCMSENTEITDEAQRSGKEPELLDCEPRVYKVHVDMDNVADCRGLRDDDTSESMDRALPEISRNMRESSEKGFDGLIIPSTYPNKFRGERAMEDAPEYLSFHPERDIQILGVRRLYQEKEWDKDFIEKDYVETRTHKMARPMSGNGDFFTPIRDIRPRATETGESTGNRTVGGRRIRHNRPHKLQSGAVSVEFR